MFSFFCFSILHHYMDATASDANDRREIWRDCGHDHGHAFTKREGNLYAYNLLVKKNFMQ